MRSSEVVDPLSPPGQTVELLERPSERPGWCLVRTTERSPPQEGLVPSAALCVSHSRSSVEMDCFFGSGKGGRNTERRGVDFLFNWTTDPH